MSWVKLDDQWMEHPKIIRAGRDARDVWLAGLTYCAKYLTDGFIPAGMVPVLAALAGVEVANCQTFASRLVDVCLWDASDNGYMVHDYLEYNPTKEQAIATKEARKEAGRLGGLAKASKVLAKDVTKEYQKSAPSPSPSPILTTGTAAALSPLEEWIVTGTQKLENTCGLFITSADLSAEVAAILEELFTRNATSWLDSAIKAASSNNARKWSYIRAILERCLRDGTGPDVKPPKVEAARSNNDRSSVRRNGTGTGKAEPKAWAGDYDQLRKEWEQAEHAGDG